MFSCLKSMFSDYVEMIKGVPWWVTLIFFVLHFIIWIMCLKRNNGDSYMDANHKSQNTLHTFFWSMVILVFPIAGALIYILFSVVPYSVWKKKAGSNDKFMLSVKISMISWIFIFLSGLLGMILSAAFKKKLPAEWCSAFIYDIPLLVWCLLTVIDLNTNYLRKSVFMTLSKGEAEASQTIVKNEFFGCKHFAEGEVEDKPAFIGTEARLARKAANRIIADGYMIQSGIGAFYGSKGTVTVLDKEEKEVTMKYSYIGNDTEFESNFSDVIRVDYIGLGVSRYVMGFWSGEEDNRTCTEKVRYRVTPRINYVVIRALMRLLGVFMMFSPFIYTINEKVTSFVEPLIHKLIGG